MANQKPSVRKPQSWPKAVLAAHLRSTAHTQEEAARIAGVGKRSLERWEQCPWWPQAVAEGLVLYRSTLLAKARRTLVTGVETDPYLALKIAERLDRELAPPKVHQVSEHLPELDYSLLTSDELDLLESNWTEELHYRLKVLTEQRARLRAEQAGAEP